jgi:lipoate-protein ligase A
MVEKVITTPRNVVDFARYQQGRKIAGTALAMSARACRHCGAALLEGESEDECSSAFNIETPRLRGGPRKF